MFKSITYLIFVLLFFLNINNALAITLIDTSSLSTSYATRLSFYSGESVNVFFDVQGIKEVTSLTMQLAGNGYTPVSVSYYCASSTIPHALIATSTFSYNVSSTVYTWNQNFTTPLNVLNCDFLWIKMTANNSGSGVLYAGYQGLSYTTATIKTKNNPSRYYFTNNDYTGTSSPRTIQYGNFVDGTVSGNLKDVICTDYGSCIDSAGLVCTDLDGCISDLDCPICNSYVSDDTCNTFYYSDDLTQYTSCSYTIDNATGSTTETEYKKYQIPLIVFFIIILPLFYFVSRFILEIIIRFRR